MSNIHGKVVGLTRVNNFENQPETFKNFIFDIWSVVIAEADFDVGGIVVLGGKQ